MNELWIAGAVGGSRRIRIVEKIPVHVIDFVSDGVGPRFDVDARSIAARCFQLDEIEVSRQQRCLRQKKGGPAVSQLQLICRPTESPIDDRSGVGVVSHLVG